MNILKKYILPAIALLAFACDTEIDIPAPSTGSGSAQLDFSNYVAVGNSLTAGFMDNGLYEEGQMNSFPAIINGQVQAAGAVTNFTQPMVSGNGSGYLRLASLDLIASVFTFDSAFLAPDPSFLQKATGSGFNNIGVPGIRVSDIKTPGYGADPQQANPFFWRMLPSGSELTTYADFVASSDPTFFTCWLGNNDVLGYATSGGLTPLTDSATFNSFYRDLVDGMVNGGAQGVVATIPDVTNIPFFQIVPWNGIPIFTQADVDSANVGYAREIDPQIREAVKVEVIRLAVTIEDVATNEIPDLAFQTAYQPAYDAAIDAGASDQEAQAIAEQDVEDLSNQLISELPDHLQGNETSPELDPLFDIIDNELANNTMLQQGIAQGIVDLTNAYDNDSLPAEQKAALDAQIDTASADQIAALKAAGIYPVFEIGANPFVIEVPVTETNPLGIRQMQEGELILFTAIAAGELEDSTAVQPKADQYILTQDELDRMYDHWNYFNSVISSYSSSSDVAVLNTNDILTEVNNGFFTGTEAINAEYIQGGAFSLDAVHLTPKGYAVMANAFIQSINSKFGSNIPTVNSNNYRGVILP
jgi:hypothetical protein